MAKHADVKAAYARLVDVSARSDADSVKAQAALESCKVRPGKIDQASKWASSNFDEPWKQPMESAKAVEEASCQLMKISSHGQLLEGEVGSLKTQISECIKHAMTRLVQQQSRVDK